eukprot:359071-Chlamydomonas_euryale.AAC.6
MGRTGHDCLNTNVRQNSDAVRKGVPGSGGVGGQIQTPSARACQVVEVWAGGKPPPLRWCSVGEPNSSPAAKGWRGCGRRPSCATAPIGPGCCGSCVGKD